MKMYVIPKSGFKIPDPSLNDHLPPEGRNVEKTTYWVRRLRDGDVTEKPQPKPQQKNIAKKEDK